MTTYQIEINDNQLKLIQDAINHLYEVDLEFHEYTDDQKEEVKLLHGMFKDLEPSPTLNSFIS